MGCGDQGPETVAPIHSLLYTALPLLFYLGSPTPTPRVGTAATQAALGMLTMSFSLKPVLVPFSVTQLARSTTLGFSAPPPATPRRSG